jgi:two-component system chemotaxis response regulator CheB
MDDQKTSLIKKAINPVLQPKVRRNIIVIGASAGGVEAITQLVGNLPATFPAAILVVLHIPAHTPSALHDILDRAGPLPCSPVVDGEAVCDGRIYVASPDRHLMIDGERVRLTRGPREGRVRPSADVLFRSAAYACGARVIGIVLTGMLDDGTAGLWAVKDRGGLTLVQSPEETPFPSMPQSAIDNVEVDAIVPLAKMPALLMKWTSEEIEAGEETLMTKGMELETRIALEDDALEKGVMHLGPTTAFTCPECHGVLVKIQEGPIIRFRCHTGHAYSMQSLLAELDEEMDDTLWNAIRTFEERVMLLREMENTARKKGLKNDAEMLAKQAETAQKRVGELRNIVMKPN